MMESAFEDDVTLLDIHSGTVAVRVVAGMTTALLGQLLDESRAYWALAH